MRTSYGKRLLTFGAFITRVYDTCGPRQARGIVRFALKAHLIEFRGPQRFVISSGS